MAHRFTPLVAVLLPFALLMVSGCQAPAAQVLGSPAVSGSAAAVSIRDLQPSRTPVTISGAMVEKCPLAGCWFKVQDKTGVVKVDTKAAGFVVVDVPVGTTVTVTGKFRATPERQIAATGLRY